MRETITATTNKVEQYNQLCDLASFGSVELVASNDENEMEKAVKYNDIILTEHIKRFGDYLIDTHRTPAQIVGASRILGLVRWRQAI